jgi:hypothetical protein
MASDKKNVREHITVTIMGAGGYAGTRILNNLVKEEYDLLVCEVSKKSIEELARKGLSVTVMEEAVPKSDFVIMAVPDALLGRISCEVVPQMKSDGTFILLDPAAAYAGGVALRDDCTFIVVHPCHPPLFAEHKTPEEYADRWGGVAAKQDIVTALIRGKKKNYRAAEELFRRMFAPVENVFRITVEQMVLLEPAMVEVIAHPLIFLMKEAMDETVRRGVPKEAVYSFMLGHVSEAMWGIFTGNDTISQAAFSAIEYGTEMIIKKDWRKVFDEEHVVEVLHKMLHQ